MQRQGPKESMHITRLATTCQCRAIPLLLTSSSTIWAPPSSSSSLLLSSPSLSLACGSVWGGRHGCVLNSGVAAAQNQAHQQVPAIPVREPGTHESLQLPRH